MPRPPRPDRVRVLECYTDPDGQTHLWADVGGKELKFTFARGAIDDRKVVYGYAHVEVETGPDGQPLGDPEIVDEVPDAEEQAVRALLAEHLDRFEEHDHDWTTQVPPDRARTVQQGWSRRADLEGERDVPSRAPDRVRPDVRRKR